jgi:hypothetical protein
MMNYRDLFHYETPDLEGGAPSAPGTVEAAPVVPDPPSAATITTDTQDATQGPIPYARFKEVNDARRELDERLQPFAQLEDVGYPAEELQRLVAWEQEYSQDPVGTWLRQAAEIDGLPDEVKVVIEAVNGTQGPPADGSPPRATDISGAVVEPPEWAQPLIQEREARLAAQEQEAITGFYDAIVQAWKDLDKTQNLVNELGESTTPDAAMHAFIASASVNAGSAEELLRTARESYLASREAILKNEIKVPARDGSVPRTVPGGGPSSTGATPPPRPRTLREATRMAQAEAEAGTLGAPRA